MKDRGGPGEDEPPENASRPERVTPFRSPSSRPGPEGRISSPGGRGAAPGSRPHSVPPRSGTTGSSSDPGDIGEEFESDGDLERLSREAQEAVKLRREKAQKVENTRRRFFVGAALWGFLAGWIAVPVGLYTIGRQIQFWRWRSLIATVLMLLICWLGARLLNRIYRDVRLRGR